MADSIETGQNASCATWMSDRLRAHVEGFFEGREIDEFGDLEGTIRASLPDFAVLRIHPKSRSDDWVYVSIGASEAMRGEHVRLEFVITSRKDSVVFPWTLAAMAHYQTDPRRRKGLGDVVRQERPWIEGSRCDRVLVSLPYPFGPALEWCDVGDGHVRFLWLVPITSEEHDYIEANGVPAFEEKLEWSGLDPADPGRRSLFP